MTARAATFPRVAGSRVSTVEPRPGVLEQAFTVIGLFLLTGALLPLLRNGGGAIDEIEGDPVMQLVWAGLYAGTLLLVLVRRVRLAALLREKWLVALVVLAVVSTLWSDVPSLTLRRSVALLGTTLFGAYVGLRYNARQLLGLARWAMLAVVVVSVILALGAPAYGIDPSGGWRGAFVHKNALGRAMALAGVLAIGLRATERRWRIVDLLLLAVSVALLLLSGSRSSAVALLACAACLPLTGARRWWYAVALVVGGALLLTAAGPGNWGSPTAEQTLEAIGRDATLTGRTELWPAVVDKVSERPWLGYGYSGFWLGWDGASADVWAAVRWQPPHAHNGLLDLALDLGVAGCALFLASLVVALARSLRLVWRHGIPAAWPLLGLTLIAMANVTESAILARNNVFWALYVAIALSLAAWGRSRARSVTGVTRAG